MFNDVKELIAFIESQRRTTPKVSLDRFRRICEIFGNPQNNINYIHVGGTNGKGSTVAYLKSILRSANYNVGTFISPYVIKFNERITYNDDYISDEDILDIGNYILSYYPKLDSENLEHLSFFEFVTLMAFIYFSRIKNLDFVILEVGIGGLLDVTNVITPLVSVISNVNYDHMNILGNTIQEIALNKLGIVKPNKPLVTIENDEINDLIIETTKKNNSKLVLVKLEDIKDVEVAITGTKFSYKEFKDVTLSLLGRHQIENAAIVLEVIKILRDDYHYNITLDNIYKGLSTTFWPGRLQVISKEPLIIMDGAHNVDGIRRLTQFIKEIKGNNKVRIVFAVSANKQKEDMIPMLEEVADEMVFTSFHYKRSDQAMNLIELSKHPNKRIEYDIEKLLVEAKRSDFISVFCGSLYFVSEIYNILYKV